MEEATTVVQTKKPNLKWILIAAGAVLLVVIATIIFFNVGTRRTTSRPISAMRDKGWMMATDLLDNGGAMIFEEKGAEHFYLVLGKAPDGGNAWRDYAVWTERDGSTLTISLKRGSIISDASMAYPISIYRIYRDARIDTLHLIVNGNEMPFQSIVACDKISDYVK